MQRTLASTGGPKDFALLAAILLSFAYNECLHLSADNSHDHGCSAICYQSSNYRTADIHDCLQRERTIRGP